MTGATDVQAPQPRRSRWWVLWLGLLLTVLIHVPMNLSDSLRPEGRFVDPDSYMRIQRVFELHTHGRWYDAQTQRINAPYGETLHWTRPLDAILLAGAWLASAAESDYRVALETAGVWVSPFLLLLLILVWRIGTRGLLQDRDFILSLIVLPLLPSFDIAFVFGRPDHHSLLNLLFVAGLVLMFAIITEKSRPRAALSAGVLSGIAIWISVAAIVATAYFATALALLWIWRGRPFLNHTVFFMASLFASISLALLIELPPSAWTVPVYDTISIVHWWLAGAGALSWVVIARVIKRVGGDENIRHRLVATLAGALVPAAAVALVFPQFYLGPFAEFDNAALDRLFEPIAELQPLLPTTRQSTAVFVLQFGPVLVALCYALYRLWRGGRTERQLMALLLLGFIFYVPLTLGAIRWAVYAQALAWLPWTLVAAALLSSEPRGAIAQRLVGLRAVAAGICLIAPIFLAIAIAHPLRNQPGSSQQATMSHGCDWQQMANFLSQRHAATNGRETLLLTDFFRGPALVWSTPYNVIGAPFGNTRALNDTFGFFGAAEDTPALEIISRRGVDLVLVCRNSGERQLHVKAGTNTLFAQLADGPPPPWLTPVKLPDPLANTFHLYQVTR